jgi:membrane-associated phospholipid phosphatase
MTSRRHSWALFGIVGAIGFAAVTRRLRVGRSEPLDIAIATGVRALPVPLEVWADVSMLGDKPLIGIGTATSVALLAAGRPRQALLVGGVLVGAMVLTGTTKVLVDRPRPRNVHIVETGLAFPSGHALNSLATYGIIALLTWRSGLSPSARGGLVLALVALVPLIGASRVALGDHWPSDVLGGWLAGSALVAVVAVATHPEAAIQATLGASAQVAGPLAGTALPDAYDA